MSPGSAGYSCTLPCRPSRRTTTAGTSFPASAAPPRWREGSTCCLRHGADGEDAALQRAKVASTATWQWGLRLRRRRALHNFFTQS